MTLRTAAEEAAADSPRLRAVHLAVLMLLAGGVVIWQLAAVAAPVRRLGVPWWAIAAGFAVAQAGAVHLRVRRDAHSIALMEIPLVFGLAALAPGALIGARIGGEALALSLWRRQRGEKLLFNLSLFFVETSAAASVYHGVLLGADPASPRGWLAAGAAIATALAVSAGSVTLVLRLSEPQRSVEAIARSLAAGVTISVGSGLIALVALILVSTDPWSLVILGGVAAMLVVGLRVFESLFRRHQDLEFVHGFAESVGMTLDLEVVLHNTLTEARRVFHVNDALLLWHDGDRYRRLHRRREGPVADLHENASFAAGLIESLEGQQQPVALGRNDPISDYAAGAGIRRGLAMPLLTGPEALGLLIVGNRIGALAEFDDQDAQLLKTIARQSVVALERSRLLHDVRRQAEEREYRSLHDALTGLPNRAAFSRAIEEALAERGDRRLLAVAILDLDRFKEINDTLGHQHGDIVLTEIARRLEERVREGDVVARLGGDEFGILVTGLRTESAAVTWTRRMAEALDEPLVYDGLSLVLAGSVGVAVAPEHGADPATLLRRADVAMYAAKRTGSRVETYSPEDDPHSTRRLAIIGELGPAIEAGQLVVHYQPKIRLADGAVVGMEALVRWQHPRLSLMPPPDFIELAEATGLIGRLTEFVLVTAAADAAALIADGHDLSVSVNVSPRCFADGRLPETVGRVIDAIGLEPERLYLEITETAAVSDSAASIASLGLLAERGVRLSVDDFGTGYSSLAYLTALPIHEMKIDRSFVGSMDTVPHNCRIVESAIGMGRAIGLSVVAEGVETDEAWRLLRRMECDAAQGFLMSRPVPIGRFRKFLEEWVPPAI